MAKSRQLREYSKPVGSPRSGEPLFLAIGRLLRPHGLHGELLMDVLTDFPERIKAGAQVYLGEQHQELIIKSRRGHTSGFLISFEGFESTESVGEFRNQYVYVLANDRPPLPNGEYYHHQMLGLSVISEEGEILGELSSVLETGSNDVYLVRSDAGKELLLPNIRSVVKEIDLDKGEMRVHLLPGLRPE
jgi:16S rRNA processing protein RimM